MLCNRPYQSMLNWLDLERTRIASDSRYLEQLKVHEDFELNLSDSSDLPFFFKGLKDLTVSLGPFYSQMDLKNMAEKLFSYLERI